MVNVRIWRLPKFPGGMHRRLARSGSDLRAGALAFLLAVGLLVMAFPAPQAHALTLQSNGCYTGYVLVPGDPVYGTNDFCVAQYEAKNVGGVATSQAAQAPWVNITQANAKTAAAAACGGNACHLITEAEWMTIAANVERQAANWSGGAVGSGCMYIGNNGNDTTCGYTNGTAADYGASRNVKARYTLSNGSQLWDFAGNVWEWTDATILQQDQPQPGSTWVEYTGVTNWGTISYANPLTNTAGLPGGANTWTSAQRLGELYSGYLAGSTTVCGFWRGGGFSTSGADVGPFTLDMSLTLVNANSYVGFRVAQVPLASSASQVTQRSLKMSSSKASDTGVTYHASFQAGSSYSLRTIVVDFCASSPTVGDTCSAPTGFSVGTPTVTNLLLGGSADSGGTWTATALNGGRTLQYTRGSPVAITQNETISFDLTGVTNPSTTGSFYGRFLLYDSATAGYTDTQPGHYVDFGGTAMSTASAYTITATIMETLKFCVYSASCGDTPAITLGHSSGGVTVIDSSAVDSGAVKFDVSSNANGNIAINLYGDTLKNGTVSSIPAKTSPGSITAGTAAFGLYLTPGANVTAQNGYGTSSAGYKLDTTQTTVAGGQQIAQAAAQTATTTTTITYGATTSPTTPAGVYTASQQLLATGTY